MHVLPKSWAVPSKFRERLGEQGGRQRTMSHEGHLLLVLHRVPDEGSAQRAACFFWRAPDGAWRSNGQGSGAQAVRAHVQAWADAVAALETKLEAAKQSDDYFAVLRVASPLVRTARNLHRVLQDAREACPGDRELIVTRDLAGEVERAIELVDGEARNALSYTVARRAEEQASLQAQAARSRQRLNELAAFFLPFTALSSVVSMKATSAGMVVGVVAAGLLLGLVVRGLVSRG